MSAQFANRSAGALIALAMLLLASACSTSGPPRPAGDAAEPVAVTEPAAEPERAPERRPRRRARDAESADAAPVEVPERLAQAHERAVAALVAEDWIEAELELEQLVLEYPDFPGPFVNLAIVYAHDGRDDEALAMLERALEIDPGHVEANNQAAILLRTDGRFDEAEQAYRRALEADPAYALAHYNLGVLLDLYLGRQAEALEHYEQYQTLRGEPDPQVGRWIIDLRRRLGVDDEPRVARGDGA